MRLGYLSWVCSAIDWKALDFESRKLESLLLRLGWFDKGHRAATDCLAMAWLFHLLPESVANFLSEADRRTVLVRAFGAPFDVKDYLKERGYRWHDGVKGANKHWWREITEDELRQEQTYLDDLYHRGLEHAHYDDKDVRNRFKACHSPLHIGKPLENGKGTHGLTNKRNLSIYQDTYIEYWGEIFVSAHIIKFGITFERFLKDLWKHLIASDPESALDAIAEDMQLGLPAQAEVARRVRESEQRVLMSTDSEKGVSHSRHIVVPLVGVAHG